MTSANDPKVLTCGIEDGHLSSALAHLANGLFEAHARDEAGHRSEGGHKQMWEAARDLALHLAVEEQLAIDQINAAGDMLKLFAADGRVLGRGHNRRVQEGSVIKHAEMDCLENAGRQKASVLRKATLYSTLSPCDMCSGTALLYKIPKIVIGENQTFQGPESYVRQRGV